jgi:hypothetical protein
MLSMPILPSSQESQRGWALPARVKWQSCTMSNYNAINIRVRNFLMTWWLDSLSTFLEDIGERNE